MACISRQIGRLLAVSVVLVAGFGGVAGKGPKSLIVQYDSHVKASADGTDINVADQLRMRSSSFTKPLETILAKLARVDKSVCDTETEIRFVSTCRSLEGSIEDEQNHEALEGARVLYGIRKAICETRVSGASLPSSCKSLVPFFDPGLSRNTIVTSELRLAVSAVVPSCLKAFRDHHYLWTSYSNNRQDANKMAGLLRSDVEMHSIISTYRDFMSTFDDLSSDFVAFGERVKTWHDAAEEQAHNLSNLHEQALVDLKESFDNATLSTKQGIELINVNLNALLKPLSAANDEVSNVDKEINLVNQGLVSMKRNIAEVYNAAASEVTIVTKTQLAAVDALVRTFNSAADEVGHTFNAVADSFSDYAVQSDQLYSKNIEQITAHQVAVNELLNQHEELKPMVESTLSNLGQIQLLANETTSTVAAIVHLVRIAQQHEYILYAVLFYILLAVVLAPFDGIVIPEGIATIIKKGYWAVQAAMFFLGKLILFSKNVVIQQPSVLAATLAMISIAGLVIIASLGSARRIPTVKQVDIENIDGKQEKYIRRQVCHSELYRERHESMARSARHSSTPPGL